MRSDQPGWWRRNLKWVLPAGCLSLLAFLALAVWIIIASIFMLLGNTDPFRDAMSVATQHPTVTSTTGTPVNRSRFFRGSINVTGDTGTASYTVPLHGPDGEGRLHFDAVMENGIWHFERLEWEPESAGQFIELRAH